MLSLRKVAVASEISQKNGYLTLFKTFLKPLQSDESHGLRKESKIKTGLKH